MNKLWHSRRDLDTREANKYNSCPGFVWGRQDGLGTDCELTRAFSELGDRLCRFGGEGGGTHHWLQLRIYSHHGLTDKF